MSDHSFDTTQPSEVVLTFRAMASPCRICVAVLPGAQAQAKAKAAALAAMAEVRRIETKYSRYQPDSIVSRINMAAGSGQAVALDDETADLLDFADELFEASDGLFDITSGVLRRAWDFRSQRLPSNDALAPLLGLIGWDQVDRSRDAITLPQASMELDFGGFGKEYACDRAATVLQTHGVTGGIVNLGGDLRVLGPRSDGSAWRIGISHPRPSRADPDGQGDEVIASVQIEQGSLATSGDYERYMLVDGRRYCHILNPRSGWPVAHWQGISVLAPACLAAGALATVAMLKQGDALDFLRGEGVAFLAIDPNGQVLREAPSSA